MDEELKNEEYETFDEVREETPRKSGLGTLGAMAIGSGLTIGGIAIVKKVKKVMADRKARKDAEDIDFEPIVVEDDGSSAQPVEVD